MKKPFRAKHHRVNQNQAGLKPHENVLLIIVFIATVSASGFVGYREGFKSGLKIEPTEVLMELCLHGAVIVHEGKPWNVACFPKE